MRVPEGWASTSLADLGQLTSGSTPSKANPAFWNGEIPWVSPKDMKTDVVADSADHVTVKALDEGNLRVLPAQSLLMVVRSGILARTFPVAVADVPVTINQDLKAFPPVDGVEPCYLAWFFRSAAGQVLRDCAKAGTTVGSVQTAALQRFGIPLAPFLEQLRIVATIEQLLSELEAGVAALERARAKLERYRASVLMAAVEGRLTEQWRKENPPDETGQELLERILVERRRRWEEQQLAKYEAKGTKPPKGWREKYQGPVGPDPSGLSDLPEGWCWATIDQLASLVTSGSRGWATYYDDDGPAVFLRIGNVRRESVAPDLREVQRVSPPEGAEGRRTRVRDNDLLISITADLGRVSLIAPTIGEAYINQHLALCRLLEPKLGPFIANYLRSQSGQRSLLRRDRGAVKAGLGLDDIREVPVPLPPLGEQDRIMESLADVAGPANHALPDRLQHLFTTMRQSILKRAFEGRLVPQDPNDEPASVLLERVRADREALGSTEKKRGRKQKPDQPTPHA